MYIYIIMDEIYKLSFFRKITKIIDNGLLNNCQKMFLDIYLEKYSKVLESGKSEIFVINKQRQIGMTTVLKALVQYYENNYSRRPKRVLYHSVELGRRFYEYRYKGDVDNIEIVLIDEYAFMESEMFFNIDKVQLIFLISTPSRDSNNHFNKLCKEYSKRDNYIEMSIFDRKFDEDYVKMLGDDFEYEYLHRYI